MKNTVISHQRYDMMDTVVVQKRSAFCFNIGRAKTKNYGVFPVLSGIYSRKSNMHRYASCFVSVFLGIAQDRATVLSIAIVSVFVWSTILTIASAVCTARPLYLVPSTVQHSTRRRNTPSTRYTGSSST